MKTYKIMLTGPSGSGKDTMANLITEIVPNCHLLSFASKVKSITNNVLEYLENQERIPLTRLRALQDKDENQWRIVMRPYWQWLGTDLVRNWVDEDY